MTVHATTPFGRRPVTAGLIERAALRQQNASLPTVHKWEVFNALCEARARFGVTDRDLAVLNALLTFHKPTQITDGERTVVFPSNATLSQRAHGMPESTLRRHVAALVNAGLILRNDSPNGKRYATRTRGGDMIRAFGFDLRPLLVRAREILEAAEEVREERETLRIARDDVAILRRDASKLIAYGAEAHPDDRWDTPRHALAELGKMLRRKLDLSALTDLRHRMEKLVEKLHGLLGMSVDCAPETSASDSQNERHHTESDKTSYESEQPAKPETTLPLALVLKACPEVLTYSDRQVNTWRDLVAAMAYVRAMMGITKETWDHAITCMGAEKAAITCAAILQRMNEVQSPGGYMRSLALKAMDGSYSPAPMVMSLLRRQAAA